MEVVARVVVVVEGAATATAAMAVAAMVAASALAAVVAEGVATVMAARAVEAWARGRSAWEAPRVGVKAVAERDQEDTETEHLELAAQVAVVKDLVAQAVASLVVMETARCTHCLEW